MEEYNGWTNYETWLVSVWIDNEQHFLEGLKEVANKKTKFEFEKDDEIKDIIEDYVMGSNPKATLRMDLINSALSRVNWREITNSYKKD